MNIYIYHFFNPITLPKAIIISGLYQSKQTKLLKIHTFYSHAQPQNFKNYTTVLSLVQTMQLIRA